MSAASWERPGVVGMDALAMANLLGLSRVSLARSCDGIEPGFEPIGAGNLAARVSVELRKSSIASDLTYDLRSGDPDFIDKLVALTFGNRSAFFASSAARPGLPRSIPQ